MKNRHPSIDELINFVQGRVNDESENAYILEHLKSCNDCVKKLQDSQVEDALGIGTSLVLDRKELVGADSQSMDIAPIVLGNEPDHSSIPIDSESRELPTEVPLRYEIDGEIARGGMGAILKGSDVELGRTLAIKVLRHEHCNKPGVVKRFVSEAQVAGQLQHPGIPPVYDFGKFEDSRPFFTMKLVSGHTFAELLAARSNPATDQSRILGIFEQVCQTVAFAHSKGVIHRDLKPENVMVGTFGEVQVMDWGLAKVLAYGGGGSVPELGHEPDRSIEQIPDGVRSNRHTLPGTVLGTPSYMSPEQANGTTGNLSPSTDVFSLGSILCEVLTGFPAYRSKSAIEAMNMAQQADLGDAIRRLDRCDADSDIVSLARQCIGIDPDDRPVDASVVANQLTSYLESVQERLKQAEVDKASETARAKEAERTVRVQQHRTVAVLVATILVACLAVGAWLFQQQRTTARESQQVAELTNQIESKIERAEGLLANAESSQVVDEAILDEARGLANEASALARDAFDGSDQLISRASDVLNKLNKERDSRRLRDLSRDSRDEQSQLNLNGIPTDLNRETLRLAREGAISLTGLFGTILEDFDIGPGNSPEIVAKRLVEDYPLAVDEIGLNLERCLFSVAPEWDNENTLREKEWIRELLGLIGNQNPWRDRFYNSRAASDQTAMMDLSRSVDLTQQSPATVLTLSRELPKKAAIELLLDAQVVFNKDAPINYELAHLLSGGEEADLLAAVKFAQVGVSVSETPGGVVLLAMIEYQLGNYSRSEQLLKHLFDDDDIIMSEKDRLHTHFLLGKTQLARGKYAEAQASFEKLIDDPDFRLPSLELLGKSLVRQGLYDQAEKLFVTAIETPAYGQDAYARRYLAAGCFEGIAHVYETRGEIGEAFSYMLQAVDFEPSNSGYVEELHRLCRSYPELNVAKEDLASIYSLPGISYSWYENMARWQYVDAHRHLIRLFEARQKLFPPHHPVLIDTKCHLAFCCYLFGDYVGAEQHLRGSIASSKEISSNYRVVLASELLAQVLGEAERFDDAIACLDQCSEYMEPLEENHRRLLDNTRKQLTGLVVRQGNIERIEPLYFKPGADLGSIFSEHHDTSMFTEAMLTLLFLGRHEDHEKLARRIAAGLPSSDDPVVLERAAKSILLNANADPRLFQAAAKAARRCAEIGQERDHTSLPYFNFCNGLGLYRNGEYEKAIEAFDAASEFRIYYLVTISQIYKALATYELGDVETARKLLADAEVKSPNLAFADLTNTKNFLGVGETYMSILVALQEARGKMQHHLKLTPEECKTLFLKSLTTGIDEDSPLISKRAIWSAWFGERELHLEYCKQNVLGDSVFSVPNMLSFTSVPNPEPSLLRSFTGLARRHLYVKQRNGWFWTRVSKIDGMNLPPVIRDSHMEEMVVGVLEYRNGRYESAETHLTQSMFGAHRAYVLLAMLFRALVRCEQGKTELALIDFKVVENIIGDHPIGTGLTHWHPMFFPELFLTCHEVRELLISKGVQVDDFDFSLDRFR